MFEIHLISKNWDKILALFFCLFLSSVAFTFIAIGIKELKESCPCEKKETPANDTTVLFLPS